MDRSESGLLLRDGFVMRAFALPAVLLFRRLGLGATLGYIVAGRGFGRGHGRNRRQRGARGVRLSEQAIEHAETLYRATDRERLSKQIAAGDLGAARDRVLTEPQVRDPARNAPR